MELLQNQEKPLGKGPPGIRSFTLYVNERHLSLYFKGRYPGFSDVGITSYLIFFKPRTTAFKMEHLSSIPLVVKNPKYTWLSSWWTGETKYMTKNTSIYRIENENLFDWNTDKYTKALFDILNTNRNILVDFKSRNLNFYHTATLGDVKGWTGKSCCRGFVYLSQHLLENNEITGWNKGGTFMHEVLAHIHYLGNIETAHQMQLFYNFETSSIDHAGSPAMEWTEAEKSRLNNLRALTGH